MVAIFGQEFFKIHLYRFDTNLVEIIEKYYNMMILLMVLWTRAIF